VEAVVVVLAAQVVVEVVVYFRLHHLRLPLDHL
jgi:hypothetical protein